jgi:archaemetzincin
MAPDGQPPALLLWWIGEAPPDAQLLAHVRLRLAVEYGVAVDVSVPAARPAGTYDERRRQHSSREMLRWLLERAPGLPQRVLGLTDVDLFIPVLTFVFGEAQLDGAAAVVSSARLRDAADPALTASRLAREAVHEVGHTFGLLHCDGSDGAGRYARPCVMARSASLRAVDGKGNRLCGDCRARYLVSQQDGSHVYREYQNPHR